MFLTSFDNALGSDRFYTISDILFLSCFSAEVKQILISVTELKYCFFGRGKAKIAWQKDELQLTYSKLERQSEIKEL